jgi:DNA-binding response OmpR family regulator
MSLTSDNATLAHVFLVEDDPSLATLVKDYLELQGYQVSVESRGDNAVERVLAAQPDALILDIMLPGKNGLDICRELRAQSDLPILMLTARTDEIDQIVGLEVGADDYICKPVQPRLLMARLNALLRRAHPVQEQTQTSDLSFGKLNIELNKQEVTLDNESLDLTTNEFELLAYFAQNADHVLSRDDLLNKLRGFGYDGLDRTVDMLVSKLRKKLHDDPTKPKRIKTIWKKGYLFVSDAWK